MTYRRTPSPARIYAILPTSELARARLFFEGWSNVELLGPLPAYPSLIKQGLSHGWRVPFGVKFPPK